MKLPPMAVRASDLAAIPEEPLAYAPDGFRGLPESKGDAPYGEAGNYRVGSAGVEAAEAHGDRAAALRTAYFGS